MSLPSASSPSLVSFAFPVLIPAGAHPCALSQCAPGQCKCESCPAKKTENTFSSSETAPPLADVSGAAQVDGEKKESSGCSCKAGCSVRLLSFCLLRSAQCLTPLTGSHRSTQCAPGKCGCGDSCSGSNKKTENTFSSSESAKPAADVSGAAQVDQ